MSDGLTNTVWLINKTHIVKEYNDERNLEKDFFVLKQIPTFEAKRHGNAILMNAIQGNSKIPLTECIVKHGLIHHLHQFHHTVSSSGEHIVNDVIMKMLADDHSISLIYYPFFESLRKEWKNLDMDRHLVSIHCDVRLSNIIVTNEGCQLIDFEYCCRGHPAVDIGNILCELYSDYEKQLYTFDSIPLTVIEHYVHLYNEVSEHQISSAEVLVGIKTSRLLWAIWGIGQTSSDEFDYIRYTHKCLEYLLALY